MTDIELPDPLPYHKFFKFEDRPEFKNLFIYVLKYYPDNFGFMYIIKREGGMVTVRVADFAGNILDPNKISPPITDHINEISKEWLTRILMTMKLIKVPQAIFYFAISDIARLVDVRLSINKMCSPGYLFDFFGKQGIPTQEAIGKPIILDNDNLKKIKDGVGDFKFDKYDIKPSAFKSIICNDNVCPLYGVITSETKSIK